jgi:ArsR family transcriptional regulator, arsenate/arsenite/antimonite-responsive transcriptional repressor
VRVAAASSASVGRTYPSIKVEKDLAPYFDVVRNSSVPTKLDRHAEQLSALGHPVRLSILRYVVQGAPEGTAAGEIQSKLDIPASTLSFHLERLASAGLLRSRREGTFIYYSAEYEELKALTSYLWEDCCKRGKRCC